MKTYRVIAERPVWTNAGITASVFTHGDVLRSVSHDDPAEYIDCDGDVYMIDAGGEEGYIQFAQLQEITDTVADDNTTPNRVSLDAVRAVMAIRMAMTAEQLSSVVQDISRVDAALSN